MKNQFLNLKAGFLSLLTLLLFSASSLNLNAPVVCDNPAFPGCQAPGSTDVFKVLLVLDESGSMNSIAPQVRTTVQTFATTLHDNATGTGEFEMGIVEFSGAGAASIGVNLTDVNPNSFIGVVNTYVNTQYSPSGGTNFTSALNQVLAFSDLDIVFFISDGNPGDNINDWKPIADQIKCNGTYIFGIALGTSIDEANIIALSGPDELNNPKSLPQGADWLREDITGLPDALVALANSLVDTEDPVVNCPANITQNNDARACNARVFFSSTATDNCAASPTVTCSPASGSLFPIGTTTVTCTAVDDVGNIGNCSFTVTVVDVEPPTINCGGDRIVNNDPGVCGANVSFPTFATDNCTANPAVTCSPASGSVFPVGATPVTCTATDGAGNAANCSFTVVVLDKEVPTITCPSDATINVGDSSDPANTGTPATADNCSVSSVTHADKTLPGSCLGESTIIRLWTAADAFINESACIQRIEIIDTTPPDINTPPDIEVECDTSTAATGFATATDIGDPNPKVSYRDTVVSGHCDFRCTIERIWTAIDDCENTSVSVQVIEKNILPLLIEALEKDIDADGLADPLFLGTFESTNPTSFRVKADEAECILQWLPATNGRPRALKGGRQGVEGTCKPGSNEVNADGRLTNPLFGEALKLALYLRLHPEFADTRMVDLDCDISRVILQGLGPSGNIRSFMDAANVALGNIRLTPHEREWLNAFRCINGQLNLCD